MSYHVVFFDKEVSRTWVNAVCIRNFSTDDDPEDMGKVRYHLFCHLWGEKGQAWLISSNQTRLTIALNRRFRRQL